MYCVENLAMAIFVFPFYTQIHDVPIFFKTLNSLKLNMMHAPNYKGIFTFV